MVLRPNSVNSGNILNTSGNPMGSSPMSTGGFQPNTNSVNNTIYAPNQIAANPAQSWYDMPIITPIDPRALIANVHLGTDMGQFLRSSTFINPPGTYITNPFVLASGSLCGALETDNQQRVADAAQWTFSHGIKNTDPNPAPPILPIIFLRGGNRWQNTININLGASNYSDLQLSFRDNAASTGNFTGSGTGSIPVISFTARAYTGNVGLKVTLTQYGRFRMILRAIDPANANNYSMFEMEWIVVP